MQELYLGFLFYPPLLTFDLKQAFAFPELRAARASCGSLRPAGAAARRPARRARGSKGVWFWIDAGALPLHNVGGHVPRTPDCWDCALNPA